MKLNKLNIFILFGIGAAALAAFTDPQYINPKSDYMFPIQPGAVNYLSGTMGELRSNHFHAGIDIKTGGVEGLPVHASNDGYISRIKVSAWGYGNALYMLHPDGQTTVYGHLKNFNEVLGNFVREAQYEKETFAIELFPEKNQFTYKKGDIIAFSGNTGGSGGPHLHFEIRDKNQHVLNPLKYGFPEVKDNIAPTIEKVAISTLDKEARINNKQGRFEFEVVKNKNKYSIKEPVRVSGLVGIELLTYDRLNGASNRNGVSCIQLNMDGEQIFYQNISEFSFGESRNILMLQNYEVYKRTGQRFNKLYVDDGNWLNFYETNEYKGKIKIDDSLIHQVEINLWDNYNNKAMLHLALKGHKPAPVVQTSQLFPVKNNSYELDKNLLKLYVKVEEGEINYAEIFANGMKFDLSPAYVANHTAVYLWDLTNGLPDSTSLCGEVHQYNFKALVPPHNKFNFYGQAMYLHFPKYSLFDTLYLTTNYYYDSVNRQEVFELNKDLYPMRKSMYVTLKPSANYPDKKRTSVYSLNGRGHLSYEGGEWENESIKFSTRSFGAYTLQTDSIPPAIKAVKINKDYISFVLKDELSGLNQFELKVNDHWVLMNYDYKTNLIWSEKLDNAIPFDGNVLLKVRDNAGNENLFTTKL